MTRAFFHTVADAVVGFLPPGLRSFSSRASARNMKIWFGDDASVHFEVQAVRLPRARRLSLEIGLHAEHPDGARNQAVLESLCAREAAWRRSLGRAPQSGSFIGRQRGWRRVSEVWDDADLEDEATAVEAAERIARYIVALGKHI